MRNHKFSVRDRVAALDAIDCGETVTDVCVAWDISVATLYGWKKIYSGLSIEAGEQRDELFRENAELRRKVTLLELDKKILQDALHLQILPPDQKRVLIDKLRTKFCVGLSRICRLLRMSRSFYAYKSIRLP